MSIEAVIQANTEALLKVAALLEESNKGREAALAKLSNSTALAGGTVAAAPTDDKPADDKKATRKGRPTNAERGAEPEKKPEPVAEKKVEPKAEIEYPAQDEVRAAAVAFMKVDEDKKPARREFMKSVMDEVGVPEIDGKRQIVNAPEESRAKVIKWLGDFAAGKKVNFMEDEGDADASVEDDDDIG